MGKENIVKKYNNTNIFNNFINSDTRNKKKQTKLSDYTIKSLYNKGILTDKNNLEKFLIDDMFYIKLINIFNKLINNNQNISVENSKLKKNTIEFNNIYKGLHFLIINEIYNLNNKLKNNNKKDFDDLIKIKILVNNFEILTVFPLFITQSNNLIVSENLDKKINFNPKNSNIKSNINGLKFEKILKQIISQLNNILNKNTNISNMLLKLENNKNLITIDNNSIEYINKILNKINNVIEKLPSKLNNELSSKEINKMVTDLSKELEENLTKKEETPTMNFKPVPQGPSI